MSRDEASSSANKYFIDRTLSFAYWILYFALNLYKNQYTTTSTTKLCVTNSAANINKRKDKNRYHSVFDDIQQDTVANCQRCVSYTANRSIKNSHSSSRNAANQIKLRILLHRT